jgi:hypothetical protein
MPPIPAPHDACALVFKAPRWSLEKAKAWATLHGFRFDPNASATVAGGTVRLTTNPPAAFLSGKFYSAPITADIQVILGIRRPRSTRSGVPTKGTKKRR